jgi:hypothetical protein
MRKELINNNLRYVNRSPTVKLYSSANESGTDDPDQYTEFSLGSSETAIAPESTSGAEAEQDVDLVE